jgi:peptide/nickel transport system substrate-binding protein
MTHQELHQSLLDDLRHGRISRRELLRRAAALGMGLPAVMGLLAACAAPVAVPASEGAAAPAGETGPRAGGESVWAAESDPVALNPITNSNFASTQGFEHCYESLTAYDAQLNIVPALAESWEQPDDLTHIFHLRQGVKWHDGSDFTAADVKYTFDIVLDPDGPAIWRSNFDQVESVEVIDDHTVQFTTKAPFPPLLGAFAILRSSAIIKQGAMESTNLDSEIIGTGPYKLVRYVPQDVIELEKFEEYWGAPLPYIDKVSFKILVEEDTRVAALRAGSIDYAFLTALGEQRLAGDQNLVLLKGPRTFLYVFIFNMQREPWSDVRVRQAISLATDRDELIEKALSGAGSVSGPIPTGFGDWYIPTDELRERWYTNDLDQARALLQEAGVAEGQTLDLLVTDFGGSGFYSGAAVVFKEQLARIGIDVQIRQVEQGVFIQEASPDGNFNYDMNINAFSPRHDPDGFVWARFYSENPYAVGYKNERMDELLPEARSTLDREQRLALYNEAQEILLDESPMLWVAVDNIVEGIQPYLKGYEQSPFTRRSWSLQHSWLDK